MQVLLVNGCPNEHGCTYTALSEIAATLKEEGIEADFFWIGKKAVQGCIACGKCREKKACVFPDRVNEFTALAQDYDGFIFGSPVYFSGMNGSLMSFMDRVFFLPPDRIRTPSARSLLRWYPHGGPERPLRWIR